MVTDKAINRIIASVIFVLLLFVFHVLVQGIIANVLEAGPLSIKGIAWEASLLLFSAIFFCMLKEVAEDAVSGDRNEAVLD